jgi:hypothetical protein
VTLREWQETVESDCRITLEHEARPYAVVIAEMGIHRAIGVAKCNPRDKYDPQRGLTIARGRAVKDLARRMAQTEQQLVT